MLTAPVLLLRHSFRRKTKVLMVWGAVPEYRQALQDTLIGPINRRQNKYELVIEYRTSVDNDVRLAAIAGGGPTSFYRGSERLAIGESRQIDTDGRVRQTIWLGERLLHPF